MSRYILALDQGTTSSRAILFDRSGNIIQMAQQEFTQHYPQPGWVEHNPNELFDSQAVVAAKCLRQAGITGSEVAAVGIANQRETTVVWNRRTGAPVYNAIVWQDRRTAGFCDSLREQGKAGLFAEKTGLVLDAYFSGTKVRWVLENVPGARTGRGGRSAVRDRGFVAHLEFHQGRGPRDRSLQRQPYPDVQYPHRGLGRRTA